MKFESLVLFAVFTLIVADDSGYFDIRLSKIEIPKDYNDGTLYLCQEFDLPLDASENYDLVKFEVLADADPMVHHMILFACSDKHHVEATLPHLCIASNTSVLCSHWIAQWSIGMPKLIETMPETGFKVGRDYFKKLHLQIHLHTETKEDIKSIIEHSGFRVHYNRESRKYGIGNVQIGQEMISIPPLSDKVLVQGGCSSACTKTLFKQSSIEEIKIYRIYIHMHGLGIKGEVVHRYQDSNSLEIKEEVIAEDIEYDYEHPTVHEYREIPITVKAGDEVILNCYYSSDSGTRHRNHTIEWGDGAHAEMCYAFVSYYPRLQNFNKCTQYEENDSCFYNPDE